MHMELVQVIHYLLQLVIVHLIVGVLKLNKVSNPNENSDLVFCCFNVINFL